MRVILEGMEVAWKLGRPLDAIRRYDDGRQSTLALGAGVNRIFFGNAIAGYGPAFGRLVEFDSLMITQMRNSGASELQQQYQRSTLRGALTGNLGDSIAMLERRVFDTVSAARGVSAATRAIAPTLMFALRAPRATWPAIDTTITDLRVQPAIALRSGNRARLKAAAEALDSVAATLASAGVSDSALSILAAESHLALNDTTAALRSLRYMLDASATSTLYFPQQSGGYATVYFVPRAMLLRADLAAATGQLAEARTWYQRFIEAWSTAVPELQPTVERARQSLARLSARP
jgi:hypothetical protein